MSKINELAMYNYVTGATSTQLNTASYSEYKDMIAWKGAYIHVKHRGMIPVLVKLLIPAGTLRTQYSVKGQEKYSKHRCAKAKVLGFYSYYTGKKLKNVYNAYSFYTDTQFYTIGKTVLPAWYSRQKCICAPGIHYFNTKACAMIYVDIECVKCGMLLRKYKLPLNFQKFRDMQIRHGISNRRVK